MKCQKLLCVIYYLALHHVVESDRILVVLPTASVSHNIFYQPIIRELSLRGHQVVAIIADPLKDPSLTNLTEIDVHDISYAVWSRQLLIGDAGAQQWTPFEVIVKCEVLFTDVVEAQLSHPPVRALIQDKDEHFDLVIVEWLSYPAMYAFKERFNCPLMGISSLGLFINGYQSIGNPTHPAYAMDFWKFAGDLTFWQRLDNLVHFLRFNNYYYNELIPKFNAIARKHFGDQISSVDEIERSVDMILTNTNPIFNVARPNVPALIEIGGIHKKARNPLPKDIKIILDNAKTGVVYFSLGTNVHTTAFGPETIQTVLNSFAKLPYTFICKWSENRLKFPENMIVRSWWPQQDILDHPNVKVFITQGGLQSAEETISSQVPVVGIPFGGDQKSNVARFVSLGVGKQVLVEDITEEVLTQTIQEVITNPKYKENMVKLSERLWDQPMPPMERAMWWIEYVLRHGGATHLRSPLVNMSWVQFLMIDIIGYVVIVAAMILVASILILKTIYRQFRPKKQKSE